MFQEVLQKLVRKGGVKSGLLARQYRVGWGEVSRYCGKILWERNCRGMEVKL